ncbi:hypothetical protein [Kytococcus sedentarius]|uniref:hypothetical protein n=1 Tax=Kytococcus sedentarius TaxID=1276 RepID=UPI0035BC540C
MEKVVRSVAALGTLAIGVTTLGHATGMVDRVGDARGRSLVTPAVAATAPAPATEDPADLPTLSATELAAVVEATNEQVFHAAPDIEGPTWPQGAVDEVDPASVDVEFQRVDAIDQAMAGEPSEVGAIRVTPSGESPAPGGRVVVLHVERTLESGTTWEELMPYLVVDDAGTGIPVGTFRALDADGVAVDEQVDRALEALR